MRITIVPALILGFGQLTCKAVNSGKKAGKPEIGVASPEVGTADVVSENVETWEPKYVPMPEPAGPETDRLNIGDQLTPGQSIRSADGRFTATFQKDSNFVIATKGRVIWATNTQNRGGERLAFLPDGNLVLYGAGNAALWSTGLDNKGGTYTRVANDGSLAVYSDINTPLWNSGTGVYPPAAASDTRPIAIGKWGAKLPWPIIPIHSVLLPDGKVFTYGTDLNGAQGAQKNYDVWNPSSNSHETLANAIGVDIFCGAPLVLPATGNVLIPGGDKRSTPNVGIKNTTIFNRDSKQLSSARELEFGRWYETATTLPNGNIMVFGGIDGERVAITAPEVYSPSLGTWRTLMNAANKEIISGNEGQWWYPRNWVAPDGKIFGMTGEKYYRIDTEGSGSATVLGNLPPWSRSYYSSAVMYAPGKILQVGGSFGGNIGGKGSDGAIDVDINSASPVITKLNPMTIERIWPSATVLPSGEVLVTNGSLVDNQLVNVALTAELWNPTTKKFRPLAKNATARMYHSTQLLLADGSVLVGGGGAPGPLTNKDYEIYYPPYLFDAAGNFAQRPTISRFSSREDYNHSSNISFGGSGTPARVVLVKTGAVTHSFDMEQRFIPLSFFTNGTTIQVKMPANANLAPPGHYILFALNPAGVPSLGKIISLGVPRPGNILESGDALSLGDSLTSPDGRTRLSFTSDGNLVLLFQNQAIWSSNTLSKGAVKTFMGEDGNLSITNNQDEPLWSSNTQGPQFAGGRLVLQNDANLVIYKGPQPYWTSGTCCR